MTFINNNFIINKKILPILREKLRSRPILMNNLDKNIKQFNPIIGSNLGIPLNILQFVFTTEYYNENIITPDLFFLQIAIGIATYGTDRLLDALYYNKDNINNISNEKREYYDYILSNIPLNILTIFSSFCYILNEIKDYPQAYPIYGLLLSTLGYKNIKEKWGNFKAIYIALFWTLGSVVLPTVIHDGNYNIIYSPEIYLPCIFTMFASSNLLDIKDIEEDKIEKINTLPVIYGENFAICISHISIILSIIIFSTNNYFFDNLLISLLYQSQNFGVFFLNYNKTDINNTFSNDQ